LQFHGRFCSTATVNAACSFIVGFAPQSLLLLHAVSE
jgi:hypothetical protein